MLLKYYKKFLRNKNYSQNQIQDSTSIIHIQIYLQSFVSIIYHLFQLLYKSIFFLWNITLNNWFICKSISEVTFVDKCPWLVYGQIVFLFFAVIATFFDVASYIFKLTCFNFLVPLPFINQGHTIYKTIFLDKMTILLSLMTYFNFVSVLSDYIGIIPIIPILFYLSFISTFMFSLHPLKMINI